MKTRTACCCCGDLSMTVSGEPERVIACHCHYCQRRTGNVFQVSCWFFADQIVSRTGEGQPYRGPENMGIDYTFCPRCGSTVYWELSLLGSAFDVQIFGIAVGSFADADPEPDLEIWTSLRHHWVPPLEGIDGYAEFPPNERMRPTIGTGTGTGE